MDTLDLVDPELVEFLHSFPGLELSSARLAEFRSYLAQPEPESDPAAASDVSEHYVPGRDGAPSVRVVLYKPAHLRGTVPAILHIHGGGYVAGSVWTFDPKLNALATQLDSLIASVDYRLAPETPFPGPLEDCYAVLDWLHSTAGTLGIDTDRIGLMGESAGGGLAAALALLARDRGRISIAFQHLMYPMLDDRTGTSVKVDPRCGQFVWTAADNAFGWKAFLGAAAGLNGVSPYAAVARALDLSRLPPTYIGVGELDLFLDENTEFARRLAASNVPVELRLYPGSFHGFDLCPAAGVARMARNDGSSALRRALAGLRGSP